jgi:asparaginyl-tRNA synthetase
MLPASYNSQKKEDTFRKKMLAIRGKNKIRQIQSSSETPIVLEGICRNVRLARKGKLAFVNLYDGTGTIQCVYDIKDGETFSIVVGASMKIRGQIVESQGNQDLEVLVHEILRYSLPMAPRQMSLEAFRQIPHLRFKSPIFQSVQRIKQTAYRAIHDCFHRLDIHEIQPTLLTSNECEAGSHPFRATTLDVEKITKFKDNAWSVDFFRREVFLTVSSQLHLEASILGSQRDSYCCTTAFRAEPSVTTQHLAEFAMFEWELLCDELDFNIDVGVELIKDCCKKILEECPDDLEMLERFHRGKMEEVKFCCPEGSDPLLEKVRIACGLEQDLKSTLERWSAVEFPRVEYGICIEILQKWVQLSGDTSCNIEYGEDLGRVHEKMICMMMGGVPTAVVRFPESLKSFYMLPGPNGTAECYDLILPDIGEVIGGSQRIHEYDEMIEKMERMNVRKEGMEWYLELRKDATIPHGGAGLGFGRLLMALTGLKNIKDLQEFPRAYHLNLVG